MEHYILNKSYIPKTRVEIISDRVEFFPKQFNMTQMSSTDATIHSAQDLIYSLHNPAPEIPLLKPGNSHKEALINLVEIFKKSTPPPPPPQYLQGCHSEVHTKKTPTGEPRKNPDEHFIPIKSILQ